MIVLLIPWDDIQEKNCNAMKLVRDSRVGKERCLVYESFSTDIQEQRKCGTYKYEYYKKGSLRDTKVN